MSGFAPGCPACDALPSHPCRRPGQPCPRMDRSPQGAPGPNGDLNPAQAIARLVYWIRYFEALGVSIPSACKTEVAAAIARWPLK